MSFTQLTWNKASDHDVSEWHFTDEEKKLNPYLGKHMVKFPDGNVRICKYLVYENGKPYVRGSYDEDDGYDESEDEVSKIEYFWKPIGEDRLIPVNDDDLCYPMSYIFDMLSGIPTPYSCWEFGMALAQFAIPALDTWIRKGVSYVHGMTPEQWTEIREKIKQAFVVSLEEFDHEFDPKDEKGNPDCEKIIERHKRNQEIRKEGFVLMAEHYMDFWD